MELKGSEEAESGHVSGFVMRCCGYAGSVLKVVVEVVVVSSSLRPAAMATPYLGK